MSDSHKAALAQGRAEGRAVRDYLEALRSIKPKRGRSRTPDSIKKRLSAIEDQLATSDALTELKLVQERRDLTAELASMQAKVDVTSLEAAFVKVAKRYSQRQGISYASWRDVGVEPAVLKKAGITRAG
jgi:uncharacterized protein YicC (UPF0701 family)